MQNPLHVGAPAPILNEGYRAPRQREPIRWPWRCIAGRHGGPHRTPAQQLEPRTFGKDPRMMRRGHQFLLLLALALLTVPAPSFAQAPYDTPSITTTDLGLFRIRLDVHAGGSGTPEGFLIQWMTKAEYDLIGGWPAYDYDPRAANCQFFGPPTLNVDPRSSTFVLAPNGWTSIEVGDLFDETGLEATYADGLTPGSEYVFRVYAQSATG